MDSNIKKEWLKELRSGKVRQGRGYLCRTENKNNYYCCLGVLCEIVHDDNWLLDREYTNAKGKTVKFWGFENEGDIETGALPVGLATKLELSDDQIAKLIELNDEEEASFSEIADYIEKNL